MSARRCPRCHGSVVHEYETDTREQLLLCLACGERSPLERPDRPPQRETEETNLANWQIWDPTKARPSVSISRQGSIRLSPATAVALGAPARVDLLRSPDGLQIALRPNPAGHVSVRHRPGGPATINARDAVRYWGLVIEPPGRCPAQIDDGVLVIKLACEFRAE